MKRGALRHFKTMRLATYLSAERICDRADALGLLDALLNHVAPEVSPRGDIGRLTDQEIADAIGTTRSPTLVVESLVKAGWLEPHPVYRLVIHDYHDHADNGVKLKLAHAGLSFLSADLQGTLSLGSGNGSEEGSATISAGVSHGAGASSPPEGFEPQNGSGNGSGRGGAGESRQSRWRRATRWRVVPAGELLTPARRQTALELGLAAERVKPEWDKFRDHEFAHTKTSVDGTWRNWVRKAVEDGPKNGAGRRWTSSKTAGNPEALAAAARRIREEGR